MFSFHKCVTLGYIIKVFKNTFLITWFRNVGKRKTREQRNAKDNIYQLIIISSQFIYPKQS